MEKPLLWARFSGRFPSQPSWKDEASPGPQLPGRCPPRPPGPRRGLGSSVSARLSPCWGHSRWERPLLAAQGCCGIPGIAPPAEERGQGWSLLTVPAASDALSRGGREGKTSAGPRRPLRTWAECFSHPECLQNSLSLQEAAFPQTFTFKSRRHQSSGRC